MRVFSLGKGGDFLQESAGVKKERCASIADFKPTDHPWLARTTTLAEYVDPLYYNDLLLPYIFGSDTDLDILRAHALRLEVRHCVRDVLELGIGTGRATDTLIRTICTDSYEAVDLSSQMIDFSRRKYRDDPKIRLVQNDSIQHLLDTNRRFDFIFSLWSFSHSVHQNLIYYRDGAHRVRRALLRLVLDLLWPGGTFFLIHVDVLSEEQRILTRQWNRLSAVFSDNEQSPSKAHIDRAIRELINAEQVAAEVSHHVGKQIQYDSLESAMEIFLNFHLECYFNERSDLPEVFTEVQNYLRDFVTADGTVRVAPACFVYELTKPPA